MYLRITVLLAISLMTFVSCQETNQSLQSTPMKEESKEMMKATTVPNDPFDTHIYTLENGLKVYISVNEETPRIQTMIAVKTGSRNDPANATGLAHYLEHMMFKGTSNIGTINWEEESVLLDEISDLYEVHRNETDLEKRKALYAKIDSVSGEAAKYAVPNEYDKMVASLGAKGTNAYTSVEQTVYINDIPSNEFDKWLTIEKERFSELVLRLFHTELEAVYEEFNISQDVDARKGNKAISETLFPSHSYGTQTTIGEGEHLKNPSHQEIHKYFDKYYVPNNMAIILAGDVDPDEVIVKIEEAFGSKQAKPAEPRMFDKQAELTAPVIRNVYGKEAEYVDIAFKLPGASTKTPQMMELISGILNNQKAGIMDVNLIQKQKVIEADAWSWTLNDYSIFGLYAKPIANQSLEELKDLLITQLDELKAGEFEEWLIPAVVKNKKLQQLKGLESNRNRANVLVSAFVYDQPWEKYVTWYDEMAKITKDEIVAYANQYLKDNYVAIYKQTGEDSSVFKVEKPTITPVPLNREFESSFYKSFTEMDASEEVAPVFVDYGEVITKSQLSDEVSFSYVKNPNNSLFKLTYIYPKGKFHDKKLSLASLFIPYLGTGKYTLSELQKELFKEGISFNVSANENEFFISLQGLDESFDNGLVLLEDIIRNFVSDEEVFKNVVSDILEKRESAKKDKRTILRSGMGSFGRYGLNNPFTDRLSAKELENLTGAEVLSAFKDVLALEHEIFYYGSDPMDDIEAQLKKAHGYVNLNDAPAPKEYETPSVLKDEVYVVDFPIVQSEVLMMSKGTETFDAKQFVMNELFNSYFGFGLSSIVFQEIREAKALAYSSYAYAGSPSKKNQPHFFQAYVGTQPDKMVDAVTHMRKIIEDMPVSDNQIESAKQSVLKKIETERIIPSNYFTAYRGDSKRGLVEDNRKLIYDAIKDVTVEELVSYHRKNIADRNYKIMILGDKSLLDYGFLNKLGGVKELTLEQVFGY